MFCIPLHDRGHAGEYRFSALSGPNLYSGPAPPTLLIASPKKQRMQVAFHTIQRQHMICIPLHCRGLTGEYRFSALSSPKRSKTCTPPRPRPSTPNPAYCFSEEATNAGCLPHHTETAHDLYSPALPRARGGVQVFSTFRLQMFLCMCIYIYTYIYI